MTDYLEKKLLDHTLGKTAFTMPVTTYLSLHTASPTDTGSHASEISTTSSAYARQSITSIMNATNATTGVSDNSSTITFGPAISDWGTITHVGVEDASTVGNQLLWGAMTSSRLISTGDSLQFATSAFAITFA